MTPCRGPPAVGRIPATFLTMPLPSPFAHLPSHCPPAVGRVMAAFHTSMLKVHATQPTHPHTDRAPALSIRPPATHLMSPAPSRATATPPIAQTHATPCADCPHQRSPSSSHPVVCHAVPAPAAGNLTPRHVPSLSIHSPAACPIHAACPLYVPPTVHAALHADLLPHPLYMPPPPLQFVMHRAISW